MTKQELINTYDSMSMPEEHVEAIEARLKKLYDNPSPSSAPEVPEESTREYKFDRKKPSAVKAAVISISAAAAAVLLVFGGRYLINGLPISSDPPLDAETEETSEPPYDTEEIRFESADDIPRYERAGCYDEYEHSLIPIADSGKAGPLFTQLLRDGKPVSVVRIKITSANSWDEMNYTEYHAVITECLSGKQLNLNISNEVTFRLGSTHSEQIIGEPSLAVGDELIAAAAEDGGEKSLVDPEELLFECFTVKGRNFAAQRHWYWLDLADNAFNHQHQELAQLQDDTALAIKNLGEHLDTIKSKMNGNQLELYVELTENQPEQNEDSAEQTGNEEETNGSDVPEQISVHISVSKFIIGGIIGIALAIIFILLKYLLSGNLRSEAEIKALYHNDVLGTIRSSVDGKRGKIDKWYVGARYGKSGKMSLEQEVELICANMKIACKENQKVYLTGSDLSGTSTEILEKIREECEKRGLTVVSGREICYYAEALEELAKIGQVVFIEEMRKSRYNNMYQEVIRCREHQISILGMIVIGA